MQQKISSISALSELNSADSIGVLDGDFRQDLLLSSGATKVVTFSNWTQGMQKLLDGEIQNLFFSSIGVQIICQQLRRDCSHVKRLFTYKKLQTYMALSLGSDALTIDVLTKAAERFKQSTEFLQINRKWISKLEEEKGLFIHLENGVVNLWAD